MSKESKNKELSDQFDKALKILKKDLDSINEINP